MPLPLQSLEWRVESLDLVCPRCGHGFNCGVRMPSPFGGRWRGTRRMRGKCPEVVPPVGWAMPQNSKEGSLRPQARFGAQPPRSGGSWRGDRPLPTNNPVNSGCRYIAGGACPAPTARCFFNFTPPIQKVPAQRAHLIYYLLSFIYYLIVFTFPLPARIPAGGNGGRRFRRCKSPRPPVGCRSRRIRASSCRRSAR